MTSPLLALVLFISLSFSVSAVDPVGLKIRITNNALQMLKEQALAVFQEQLINQLIPTRMEKYGFTVSNLILDHLGAIRGDLKFQDNSRLKFEIMDSTFSISCDIKIPLLFLTQIKLTIAAEKVKANMEVSLTRSAEGHLAVHMPVCEASAEKLLPITNGIEWPKTGTDYLPKIFSFSFCTLVSWFGLPAVSRMLTSTPMNTVVSPDFNIAIDYTLTRDVQMTTTSLDLSFKGLFFRPGDVTPANPAAEPAFNENTHMAYVGVSELLFNSAATSFYNAGVFMTQQPWHLTDPIGAEIHLTEAPSFSITEKQGVTINLRAKLQDSVPGTGTSRNLLSVSTRCEVSIKVSTDGTRLFLPYDNISCGIVTRNAVRDVLVKPLNSLMNNKISSFLEGFFKDGVQLPLPEGMIFTQQMIKYHNGFVVLGGSLSFTPAGRQAVVNMVRGPGK